MGLLMDEVDALIPARPIVQGSGVPPEAERSEGRCSSALACRPPAGSGRDCYTANTGRKREETALADGTDSATATSGFFRVGCMRGLGVISPVVY